ncbi:protein BCP1 [Scheffersomyces xylosifermentans]|uniref:protein BCP1 n=1 Tax=Scheffersomyces xylosifermentans TaxID=1304137 RepID=UPI00315C5618
MAKRRVEEEEDSDIDVSSTDSENEIEETQGNEDGNGAEEEEIVNVDFDFFDLNPEVDFHATKTFLRQLFGDDAGSFDISGLADLILTKNAVGTTIKTDGKESDPFALLSVINLTENLSNPSIKKVVEYVFQKTSKNLEFNLILKKLLANGKTTKDTSKQLKVGLIISERMINMPVEVVPPMYKMLLEEMANAEDAHEKYEFDYFLVISKVYELVDAAVQEDDDTQKSKKKKPASKKAVEMDYFHYEDMILEEKAAYKGIYNYTQVKQETDSRRVFTEYGIDPKLSLILIEKDKLAECVPEMEEKFPPF